MIIDHAFSEELASDLLEINAVLLRPNAPFTWSSGWNSPIYCDNRKTLNYPELREKIADKFVSHIQQNIPAVDVITGTATAGIPHAAWVADRLRKPMAYVRSRAKQHGTGNQIEGGVKKGQTTVVIEDLMSTGTSVFEVINALEFVEARVVMAMSIFTYGFDLANEEIEVRKIPFYSLTDYNTLIKVALESGHIKESDMKLLQEWRKNPAEWPNNTL